MFREPQPHLGHNGDLRTKLLRLIKEMVLKKIVLPAAAFDRMISWSARVAKGSSPLVGSSKIRRAGSCSMAQTRASFFPHAP
jgi:hypothetical protein